MQSIFFTALMASASFFPLSIAQTSLDDVDEPTRAYWCQSQVASCPLLCEDLGKEAVKNECYPDNLFYSCMCTDGVMPNLTEYSQTIPYFRCTIDLNACTAGCKGNPTCNTQCPKTHVCGASSPKKANKTNTATSTASKTATAGSTSTGSNGDSGFASAGGTSGSATTNNSGAAGLAISFGKSYGLGLVAVIVGGAFMGL